MVNRGNGGHFENFKPLCTTRYIDL